VGTTQIELVANLVKLADRWHIHRPYVDRTSRKSPTKEGVSPMPVTLVTAALEQAVQWRYGTAGAVAMLLISVGIKADIPALTSIGAVMLVALLTGPAVSS